MLTALAPVPSQVRGFSLKCFNFRPIRQFSDQYQGNHKGTGFSSIGRKGGQMNSAQLARNELYDLVWREPLRHVAKRFGVSDVAIAKHCRKADIPLPGLGYWAKKEARKAPPQPPLPARGLGQANEIKIGPYERYPRSPSDEELMNMEIPPPPVFEDDL